MIHSIQEVFNSMIQSSIAKDDTSEIIIKKRMLFIISSIVSSAGLIWSVIYFFAGYQFAAIFPFLYALISALGIMHLVKTQKLYLFQIAQLYAISFIPFLLMWSLGGFYYGSMAMMWAFYAPVATIIYTNEYSQSRWFTLFSLLTIISIAINDYLPSYVITPDPLTIKIFFALNILGSLGGVQLLVSYFARIRQEASDKELEYKSTHDTLTGLANQKLLTKQLNLLCHSKQKVSVYVIAIDRFKSLNDSFGHHNADLLLVEVAKELEKLSESSNSILARLSGPEFCIVTHTNHFKDNIEFVHSILKVLNQTFYLKKKELFLTASIGISIYPDDGLDAHDLLHTANSAMHNAKIESKNSYQFYTQEMTLSANKRVDLETKLRLAIKNREFVVFYQAQYNTKTNVLTGMEALVRWMHPTEGMISPADFIPLAEENGLIIEIDRFVMQEAMSQFKEWYDSGLCPGVLSINLSMKQLEQSDFIDFLKHLLVQADTNRPFLNLEITESQIMQDPDEAIISLNKIRELGVNLAIDDFGTGHSSLSYLKRLPVQKLKIDQSFVRGLPEDQDDIAIVKSVISLAENLHLAIIAEGVETDKQCKFLQQNNCEEIQGYYYARPMNAEAIEKRLHSNEKCCYI